MRCAVCTVALANSQPRVACLQLSLAVLVCAGAVVVYTAVKPLQVLRVHRLHALVLAATLCVFTSGLMLKVRAVTTRAVQQTNYG